MAMTTLHDLYVEQLQDLYSAEKQIVDALPKMEQAASSSQLRSSFATHRQESENHAKRLEVIFTALNVKPGSETCEAMQGIVKESEELMSKKADPDVMDAGLIASAQRVEHYEIAGYGTVRTWANMLARPQDAEVLDKILAEEKATDQKLTSLAESTINRQANA